MLKYKELGTDTIIIEGVKKLHEGSYTIMPDRIEAGTFLCIIAATGGKATLKNVEPSHITSIISKLEETDCKIEIRKNEIDINAPKRLKSVDIKTMPYPGFPTDMQSVFAASLIKAKGTSIIVENIFENRYKFMQELVRMGAKVSIEGKTAIIKGTKKLYGANVTATDLRGGAAMVLAALTSNGITYVDDIKYILRGYDKFDIKLKNLGADIIKED